ncbi:MAG: CPBP family intramembrane metalloprotease [Xanthomonadales bacterium]|nr:CPBP family intramembrane metalloprotease [Xanthomonadales bacterium]
MPPGPAHGNLSAALRLTALLLGLLWLLVYVPAAQLDAEARAQSALYARGDSPFRWSFSDPDALAGPALGAQRLDRARGAAAALRIAMPNGDANLGLRLSGRRVDPSALPRLRLRMRSERPLQWRLAAASDLKPDVPAGPWMPWPPASAVGSGREVPADAQPEFFETDLSSVLPPLDAPLAQLRLQLMGEPGQVVELQSLSLHPACAAAHCQPQRVELPPHLLPSQRLAARDAALLDLPQAPVGVQAPEWLVRAVQAMRALNHWHAAAIAALLVLACALGARLLSMPVRRAFALLIGAGLPILLLSLGLPRFPPQAADLVLIVGWVTALWWLRPAGALSLPAAALRPEQVARLIGSRRAWRSALVVTAAGLLLLTLLSVLGSGSEQGGLQAERSGRYLAWAALQQVWLALFLLPHLREPGKDAQTAALAGLLFAALHLPNAELMALCLIGGWAWSRIALKHGSLLPQILSHAALGLAASALLPQSVLRSLEVGGRYVFAPL